MADFFDTMYHWLTDQALTEIDLSATVAELGQRLLDGGIPIARINIGQVMMHPVIGLVDMQWDGASGRVTSEVVPRERVNVDLLDGTPFGEMALGRAESIFADLSKPGDRARYEMFDRLAQSGLTGYAAFSRAFGLKQNIYSDIHEDFRGASVSFATRRLGGFTEAERAGLERLITPLCVCQRVATDRFLATELLSVYLGRVTGNKVFTGQSARGDGERIECVLFCSDMRNSLRAAEQLDPETFLAALNRYFDCTAGAVLDHGGEVLKFIGDGVLAIFPIVEPARPRGNMCSAAISAAREAFTRAESCNAQRSGTSEPAIEFGVALHVGEVIYGNVGTERRMDFTATGPAVGLVSRCEALTRDLDAPLIATADFAAACPEPGRPLGDHRIRGFADPVALTAFASSTG